jgi:hypothetical protein
LSVATDSVCGIMKVDPVAAVQFSEWKMPAGARLARLFPLSPAIQAPLRLPH